MNRIEDAKEDAGGAASYEDYGGVGPDVAATFNVPAAELVKRLAAAQEKREAAAERTATELARRAESPERRIAQRGMLHNVNGRLNETGWMTAPLLRFDAARVKAGRLRLKRTERYLINDDDYALWVTVADFGYVGLVSAQVANLVHPSSHTVSVVVPLPGRRFSLPESPVSGITRFSHRRAGFLCRAERGERRIVAHFDEFAQGETLAIDALLDCQPDEQLANVLAWPNDPRAFHYHTLVPAMRASGSFKVGHRVHGFSPTRSFGLFSWNRGVWPLETEHVWGIAQGWQDGTGGAAFGSHTVALQMVAGLDERAATQNAFFLDGRVIKLGHVDIQVPPGQDPAGKTLAERFDLLGSWRITDDAVAVDLTFAPANDAADSLNAYAVFLDRHQVFGTFSGTVQIEGHPFVLAGLFGVMAVEHAKL